MRSKQLALVLSGLTGAWLLLGCAATAPPAQPQAALEATQAASPAWQATYAELARGGGKVYRLEPENSTVRIYVFRGGRAAKVGHNHVLSAPKFAGFVYLPSAGFANTRFDLEFRLDELEFDNPETRASLGSAYASALSNDDIRGARDHMLGDENLQAKRFPFVRVHGVGVIGEAPKLAANVQVELHGQMRPMWLPLTVEGLSDRITISGSFVLRQSDFGVSPYSVLGLLAVQDEVVIEFRLLGVG